MIEIITNALGSGDWVVVWDSEKKEEIFSGHGVTPRDLRDIVTSTTGKEACLVEITDRMMEEGDY
jgi:hypothetical protein